MGDNIDLLKGEFTRKPEELQPKQLEKAQGLASILTIFRKFLYLFFSIGTAFVFLYVISLQAIEPIPTFIAVLLVPYMLFKFRDYIRGTI